MLLTALLPNPSCTSSMIIKHHIPFMVSSCSHLYQYAKISKKHLIRDINLLHAMGYLPFQVLDSVPVVGNRVFYLALIKWDDKAVPQRLTSMLKGIVSSNNIIYTSAVKRLEKQGLKSVQLAYNLGIKAKKPFVWVYVNQKIRPEKLYVWETGHQHFVFKSLVNTGIMDTTVFGDFYIYRRMKATEMRGYFPGSHQYYDDPDVPWVNYFYKGEAIHGYYRYVYGFPQSAGCVELPIHKAKALYPLLYRGALVSVSENRY